MKKVFLMIFIIVTIIIIDGFLINPKGYKINSKNIEIQDLTDSFNGFKILQISDFLIKDSKDIDRIQKISNKVNELAPDIIVFTGDLLYKENNLSNEDIKNLQKLLKKMTCTLYKYAVIGDNDDINSFETIMNEADFKILNNESSYIFYKDVKPIKITGITNLDNVSKALTLEDNLETTLNLVITHYPDNFEVLKNENVDIILAGHSLNGQITMPFYGGLIKPNGSKKYTSGIFEENNTKLFISGGIGAPKVEFRLFNKPEINLYKIQKK